MAIRFRHAKPFPVSRARIELIERLNPHVGDSALAPREERSAYADSARSAPPYGPSHFVLDHSMFLVNCFVYVKTFLFQMGVAKRINVGTNGLQNRMRYYTLAKGVLGIA